MKLYAFAISNYCSSVKIALNYKSLSFEEIPPPDGYGSEAYKRIVPMGTIPALRLDDDFIISESSAILEFLEENFRGHASPRLLFDDARKNAAVRFVHRLHDLYLEPPMRSLFAHMDPLVRDMSVVEQKVAMFYKRLNDLETSRQRYISQYYEKDGNSETVFTTFDKTAPCTTSSTTFGPYFFGDQFTFADCVLPPTLVMADVMHRELLGKPVDYSAYPSVATWRASVETHPAVAPVLAAALSATEAWAEKKRGGAKSTCTL